MSSLRPVTILSGFEYTLPTSSSFSATLANTITAESSQPVRANNDLSNAANAFFRNKGAMAGLFTAVGFLVLAAFALCLAYRRRAMRRTQDYVDEHVSIPSLGEKHEAVGHLHERTGTTFRLGPAIQSYRDHPFASPELSISGRSTPSTMVHHLTDLPPPKKGSQSLALPISPSLEEFVALGASRYHLSANLYLPDHPQPPLLLSEESRHRIRTGEKGKGLAMEEMASGEFRLSSRQTLSKQTSTKSSQSRSWSSRHRSTVTSTTSSAREEREWWWNRRRVRANRVTDEWAMFRSPLETSSTGERERRTRQKVDSIELGGIELVKDTTGAYSFEDEGLTGKSQLPVLPLLSFQKPTESKPEGEDLGPSEGLLTSREEAGSRKKLPEPSSGKKLSKGSRKTTKGRDARGSEAVFTLADALTHSRHPTELDESKASGGRVRSPFTSTSSASAQLGRTDPTPRVDLHPYAR